MTTASLENLPTPAEIDAKAKEYCELEDQIDEIEQAMWNKIKPLREQLAPLRDELKAWGETFGGAHERKSKLLTGLVYEVMTTTASSTSLEQAAAAVFFDTCKKAKETKLFRQLFETLTTYRARPDADQVARTKLTPKLALAFARCFVTKTFETRLQVRPRKKAACAAS